MAEHGISDLKPYPNMKDSGVEGLGKVPAHWDVLRLRNVTEMRVSNVDKHSRQNEAQVRLCNYVDVYKNDRIRPGMPFMRATATANEIERFGLRSGDVLITKDSEVWNDIGVPAIVEETEEANPRVVSGYHLALLRPYPERINSDYLFRSLQSTAIASQLHVQANGVTRFGLTHNAIKTMRMHYTTEGIRVVRLQNIGHGEFIDADSAFISLDHYATLGDHSVVPEDVLIAGLGDRKHPPGRACVAPEALGNAMVKADCFRFRINRTQVEPRFVATQLTATASVASAILSRGATRQRTNLESTSARTISIPPLDEQASIIDYLEERTHEIRAAHDSAKRELILLNEYRACLIEEVVAGRIDVS